MKDNVFILFSFIRIYTQLTAENPFHTNNTLNCSCLLISELDEICSTIIRSQGHREAKHYEVMFICETSIYWTFLAYTEALCMHAFMCA